MEVPKRTRNDSRALIVKKDKDTILDAGIWSELQYHVDLQTVYEKLPCEEIFRLRVVCKAWNQSALQRLEPKPYFVIIPPAIVDHLFLNGVLTYDVTSEKYSFKRQRFPLYFSHAINAVPFEVEGLIFCHHPDNLKQQGVFNIHTKIWHSIPPPPKACKYSSAIGMMVDTSQRPYSFKLIVGSNCMKTQIYDSQSQSWSTTSSQLTQLAKPALKRGALVSCVCNKGHIYISLGASVLLMYSLEDDTWTIPRSPPGIRSSSMHALGVWEGRIFTTLEDHKKNNFTVWELVDQTKEWVEYAVMPEGEYDELMKCDFRINAVALYEMIMIACFCNGYLLIYSWQYCSAQSETLMLCNLATKEWKHVHLRPGKLALKKRIKEDSEFEATTDECFVDVGEPSYVEGDLGDRFDDEEDFDIKSTDPTLVSVESITLPGS